MRTGVATVPLDWGKCPPWLFRRMKALSRGIMLAIAQEFGTDEVLKRLSDPVWFQSLGCVVGFDWNSSGLFTTTMGALKEGLRGLESELGIFICGGKGKTSRKCPQQIQDWGEFLHLPMEKIDKLIYASKISAKIDSSALQDGFQIYAHNFIFTKSGQWNVIQQGMNTESQRARRYHWLSSGVRDFVEEPHSGIISDIKTKPLNLTAKESSKNRNISAAMVKEEPKTFLRNIKSIQGKSDKGPLYKHMFPQGANRATRGLIKKERTGNLTLMELKNVEFHWHPVVEEKFNLKRLEKTIFFAKEQKPQSFEQLLSLKGVGPKTIRALSLVSELIYGAKPSYEDPARYSFAHGGKDSTPYPVSRSLLDATIDIMQKGIKKSQTSLREKQDAFERLKNINQS